MVGLIIPDKACYVLAGLQFGDLGICSLISIAHVPWNSRSLLRTPVMEIARLMKRKQKRRSGFTGDLAFASIVRFLTDMFL